MILNKDNCNFIFNFTKICMFWCWSYSIGDCAWVIAYIVHSWWFQNKKAVIQATSIVLSCLNFYIFPIFCPLYLKYFWWPLWDFVTVINSYFLFSCCNFPTSEVWFFCNFKTQALDILCGKIFFPVFFLVW